MPQRRPRRRARLLNQVDERRVPRTAATVGELLERHLGELRVARKPLHTYQGYVDKHVMTIASSLGGGDKVENAIADFAETSAAQNEADYAALQEAVASGRAEGQAGI
jgi:hypothetical protein